MLADGLQCYFYIHNNREYPIRRVKLALPTDLRKSAIPDVPLLEPGQCVCICVEMSLSSHRQIKVEVRSDRGSGSGMMTIAESDLLVPWACAAAEFAELRGRLGGFNEVRRVYPLQALSLRDCNEGALRIRRDMGLAVVQSGSEEAWLAGRVRKGIREERALVTLQSDR